MAAPLWLHPSPPHHHRDLSLPVSGSVSDPAIAITIHLFESLANESLRRRGPGGGPGEARAAPRETVDRSTADAELVRPAVCVCAVHAQVKKDFFETRTGTGPATVIFTRRVADSSSKRLA